jgi:hypothetical protein
VRLVIGAPIRDRAWILRQWFDHTLAAVEHAVHVNECELIFIGSAEDDPETYKTALSEARRHGITLHWLESVIDDHGPYERRWTFERYSTMVALRNQLLREVRRREPDVFWSLDSDILVAECTLSSALQHLDRFDAVGTKLYMTPVGRFAPSYAMLPNGGALRRDDADGAFKVDAIMASKVLTSKAYDVNYVHHRQGEDIGWSVAARAAGCSLGWDGTVTSKHVMERESLGVRDKRCGY